MEFSILFNFLANSVSIQVQFIWHKLNLNCCSTHYWTFMNWVQRQFRAAVQVQFVSNELNLLWTFWTLYSSGVKNHVLNFLKNAAGLSKIMHNRVSFLFHWFNNNPKIFHFCRLSDLKYFNSENTVLVTFKGFLHIVCVDEHLSFIVNE